MNEALTRETPDAIYRRGLNGESDVYYVFSGPNETRGWGSGVPLFHIEMPAGEPLDASQVNEHLSFYEDVDPQPPRLLSCEELEAKLAGYYAAQEAEAAHAIREFKQLTGLGQA